MVLFLFFFLQSSLIINTAFVKCSDIFDSFYYFGDDESTDMVKQTKLPPIIPPSSHDLNSLSLDNSPILPSAFTSRNNSPSYININEYSNSSQVLTAEDDYFFLYLDNLEYILEKCKLDEELILVGSEFVSKDQVDSIKINVKDDSDKDEPSRERADSGLYEMIVSNLLFAVSTLSPKSVRQMFEPKAKTSGQIKYDKKRVNPVKSVKETSVKKPIIRKESSDDFSDMIKRYYKSYLDLEKAEHLAVKDEEHY